MTTICYRDGIIATDTLVSRGDMLLPQKFEKIKKIKIGRKMFICAVSGDVPDIELFLYWFKNYGYAMDLSVDGPHIENSFECIVYDTQRKEMHLYNERCVPIQIDLTKPLSLGSGLDFAYGAFAVGASAIEAVNAAKTLCAFTGGNTVFVDITKPDFEVVEIEGHNER